MSVAPHCICGKPTWVCDETPCAARNALARHPSPPMPSALAQSLAACQSPTESPRDPVDPRAMQAMYDLVQTLMVIPCAGGGLQLEGYGGSIHLKMGLRADGSLESVLLDHA